MDNSGYQSGGQAIEQRLAGGMYLANMEKTFFDKAVARQEIDEMKQLMTKEKPNIEDINRLHALIGGSEVKLLNLNENTQYINGKFFVWLTELKKETTALMSDYEEHKNEQEESKRKELYDSMQVMIRMFMFGCGIFHFMTRSTLSIHGGAFDTLTKNKFEHEYNYANPNVQESQQKKRFGVF